jgi:hypothetical protein
MNHAVETSVNHAVEIAPRITSMESSVSRALNARERMSAHQRAGFMNTCMNPSWILRGILQ